MLLIKAAELYGWKNKIFQKLKKEPEKIKALAGVCKDILEFLQTLNVEVVEVRKNTIDGIPEIMFQYGLIGNDAITYKIMREKI